MPEALVIPARDGFPLAADLFLPEGTAPRAAVLVAPAMGVPRGYYAAFAAHLARSGMAAITVDYRGIGGSRDGALRGFRATLHEWAEADLAGALDALAARLPGLPLLWVGHSVGGQLFGLLDEPRVRAALFVGAQSGHWRLWRGAGRLGMLALWYAVIPALVPLLGRLPGAALGGGEDVPAGVALEWAAWGRRREYALSYARPRGGRGFARFAGPLRSYAIADDGFAPLPAVSALLGCYAAARADLRVVRPSDIGERTIGHFGFFRPKPGRSLWAEVSDWLPRAAEGSGA
ncbi:MAG TPA: alpha/beta fold hydrolase [Anaeromyxobacter sp.]